MPCYVIVTVSIAFKVENKDLFKKTLEVMDWTKRNEMSGVVNVEDDRGNNISLLCCSLAFKIRSKSFYCSF